MEREARELAEAEVARLRRALEEIAAADRHTAFWMQARARRALIGDPDA